MKIIHTFLRPFLLFLSGALTAEVCRGGLEAWYNRIGAPGGEILILPLLGVMLLLGWIIGKERWR